jgi:long-chain fatty acid transport protein
VRAYSRGGAFVAGADDLTALYYNPAALTRLGRGTVTLNVAGVDQSISFDRLDYPGEGPGGEDLITAPVNNDAPAYAIPHVGVSHTFGLPNTTFAAGFYPPYAPDVAYPSDGAQRYSLVDTLVIQTVTGASVAHKVLPWLSVGLGATWNVLIVEQDLNITLSTNTDQELDNYDVAFHMEGTDMRGFGWNAGILIEPPDGRFAIGAMILPPVAFQTTGLIQANFAGNFYYEDDGLPIIESEVATDDDIALNVTMPIIIRTGALVRPTDNIEIEAGFFWENWGSVEDLIVTNMDMTVETVDGNFAGVEDIVITDDVVLPVGYNDVWSVRLGGQVDIGERAVVRAGTLYESAAIPDKSIGPNAVDSNKLGVGLGGTWRMGSLDLDVGAYRAHYFRREIRNSEVTQIAVNPLTGEVQDGRIIGDGDYESALFIFGGGLTWQFGPDRGI